MTFTIRPFAYTEADYEGIAAVELAIFPDNPDLVADFKHHDETRNPDYFYRRVVVEQGGEIVAYANYGQMHWAAEAAAYSMGIYVHPAAEGNGVGTAVYAHILAELRGCDPPPARLYTFTREDKPRAMRFLQERGFEIGMRWIASTLDVARFDAAAYAPLAARLAAAGVDIVPLPALRAQDPDWAHKLYELDWACTQDEPQPTPPKKLPFADYERQFLNNPSLTDWLVAVVNDEYVGMTQLYKGTDDAMRRTGFTGVVRGWRRRGLATLLKVRAIAAAQQQGVALIRTGNEAHNPMLALNRQLGFEDVVVQVSMQKEMGTEGATAS
ncbi:MAG: GNAT family N-acetyltransferase [Anaerolineales bacterium]|nr:GNAT family N-acetyltransferase [Anaerolineales bacterium]